METFYFTFGQAHETIDGQPMKDFYVKVHAETYDMARAVFINTFTTPLMPSPNKWSFQYTEKEFIGHVAAFYPKGCFATIVDHGETAIMTFQ